MNNATQQNVRLQDEVFTEALEGLFGNKDFSLQILEKFPLGVFSPDGALVFVNPAFREVYNIK